MESAASATRDCTSTLGERTSNATFLLLAGSSRPLSLYLPVELSVVDAVDRSSTGQLPAGEALPQGQAASLAR